ncbi:hypothetical protein [Methylobacterium sp. ID0610]|uniref:hypothetical protein n=1 Tax=Methylobacterium carpenticola TaxID=3344827 RepID=UPI0036763564
MHLQTDYGIAIACGSFFFQLDEVGLSFGRYDRWEGFWTRGQGWTIDKGPFRKQVSPLGQEHQEDITERDAV